MLDLIFGAIVIIILFLIFKPIKGKRTNSNYGNRINFKSNSSVFLCDNCKYDYDRACSNLMRPNAKVCNQHSKRF